MKFCSKCGKELLDEAIICPNCGCQVGVIKSPTKDANAGLGLAAKVLMIISCVAFGWALIPLAWMIPMTVSVSNKLKSGEEISVGLKVCTLLFVNVIAGILLLCMDD